MRQTFLAILLIISGPLLILGEKMTYGEASALRIHHIIDWFLAHRPYHLLFWALPIAGLAILLIEMMNRTEKK